MFQLIEKLEQNIFQLYAASIDEAVCMASRKCDGDPHKIPKDCKFLNGTKSGKHTNDIQKNVLTI